MEPGSRHSTLAPVPQSNGILRCLLNPSCTVVDRGSSTNCWLNGANIGAAGLGGGNWVGLFATSATTVLVHEVRCAAGWLGLAFVHTPLPVSASSSCGARVCQPDP